MHWWVMQQICYYNECEKAEIVVWVRSVSKELQLKLITMMHKWIE